MAPIAPAPGRRSHDAAPGTIRHAQEAAHAEGAHVATSIQPIGSPRPDHEANARAAGTELKPDLDAPLYTERDAVESLRGFRPIPYGREEEVAPGIHATYVDAGHILGSAIIRLRVQDVPGGPERILVFSGDLGRTGAPIIADPTPMSDADYVLCESTYGGREHEPTAEAHRILTETVRLVAEHQGVLLVPSFAIGRTQELVWELDRLVSSGEIPALPLYLDSPMASKASDIYRRHTEYYDADTRALFESGHTPLDYPNQVVVHDMAQSMAIAKARRPYMIVASNGMLTGGRVVGHLRNLIDDPAATILFVGYQGEGTLGRHLQEGAKTVRLDGQVRDVRCRIASISGFSAHADEPGLLAWLAGFARGKRAGDPGFPRRVFLVHGDPGPQAELRPEGRGAGPGRPRPALARGGHAGLTGAAAIGRSHRRQPPGEQRADERVEAHPARAPEPRRERRRRTVSPGKHDAPEPHHAPEPQDHRPAGTLRYGRRSRRQHPVHDRDDVEASRVEEREADPRRLIEDQRQLGAAEDQALDRRVVAKPPGDLDQPPAALRPHDAGHEALER